MSINIIAIDDSPLRTGHSARGTGVYTKNLINALSKIGKKFNIKLLSENVSDQKFDLIHYPYFDLFYNTLSLKKDTKTVVTVHDVTPLIYPKYYPPGVKGRLNFMLQKYALRRVDALITVSETSKKDIVRFLDVPAQKITVTYEAPNFKFSKQDSKVLNQTRKKFNLPAEFILYVGDVNWNKNIVNLVKAIKIAKTKLVIVGKSATNENYDKDHVENQPLVKLQKEYGEDGDIFRLGFLEDSELNAVWQLATAYCMPSLYEGFGLPVVEAMAAKIPVVCSRTQALVEIAGEAALYFDPHDTEDIANKIRKVLSDKSLRESLTKKGTEQVKRYSWEKMARETSAVYEKVLGL